MPSHRIYAAFAQRLKRLAGVMSVIVFAAVCMRAADSPIEIPEVVVEAQGLSSDTVPSLQQKSNQVNKVMGGASVVDADNTRKGRASTVADSLKLVPGVYAQPRFGAEEARLSIRGSGLQRTFHGRGIKVLQDGAPINLADGGFDFQALDPLSVRYIEVYRGANALEFGAANLGGAINYVSRTGRTSSPFQARYEGGSYQYHRGQLSSGRVIGDSDYYGSLSEFYQDGFREHSRQNTQRFFGNFGHRFSGNTENRTYLTYVRTDSELPGSLTKAQMNRDPRQANAANISGDQKRDFNLFRLANKTTFAGNGQRFDLSGYYSWKHLDHPIFQVIDQLTNDAGVTAAYTNVNEWLGRRNRFMAGITPSVGVTRDQRYVNVSGGRGAQTGDSDQTSTNAEAFVENQIYVTKALAIGVGAQAAYAERKNEDNMPVTPSDKDNSDTQTYSGFSPKIGARYEFNSRDQIYTNIARSFEPPSFGELVGNNVNGGLVKLDAQTATTFEVGTRGQRNIARWDVSVYHALVKDELLSLTDAAGNPLGTVNANETIHEGVEAGLDLALLRGLLTSDGEADQVVLRQAYTINHFTFDNDPVYGTNDLAGVPGQIYQAELQYEHPTGWYGGPSIEWVPVRFPIDHKNTFFADPYSSWGFKAGYRPRKGLSIFVDARNLGDKIYAGTTGVIANANGADSAQFLPADGRSVYGGIEWNF